MYVCVSVYRYLCICVQLSIILQSINRLYGNINIPPLSVVNPVFRKFATGHRTRFQLFQSAFSRILSSVEKGGRGMTAPYLQPIIVITERISCLGLNPDDATRRQSDLC